MARIIAPRLASKKPRESFGHGLPGPVKAGLRLIAERENKSMSWVMEELIYRGLGIARPKFLPRKNKSNS